MMDKQYKMRPGESPMERALSFISLVEGINQNLTDDEINGLGSMVYKTVGDQLTAILEHQAARETVILTFKKTADLLNKFISAKKRGEPIIYGCLTQTPDLWNCFDPPLNVIQGDIPGAFEMLLLTDQADRNIDYAGTLGFQPEQFCPAPFVNLSSICMSYEWFKPDLITTNTFGNCQGHPLAFSVIGNYFDIPMILSERPNDNSPRGREQHFQSYSRMIREIEQFTGSEFKTEKLREAIKCSLRMQELWRDLWELKKHKPQPVPNVFWFVWLVTRFLFWGSEDGVELMESMIRTAKERMRTGGYEEIVRFSNIQIMYVYDLYNGLAWAEKQGIFIEGDTTQLGHNLYEQAEPIDFDSRESMIRSLANNHFYTGMLMHFGSDKMAEYWLTDIFRSIRELDLDGVMSECNKSCTTGLALSKYIKRKVMEETGLPTLIQYGDYMDRRDLPMDQWQKELMEFVNDIVLPLKAKRKAKRTAKTG